MIEMVMRHKDYIRLGQSFIIFCFSYGVIVNNLAIESEVQGRVAKKGDP